MGAEADFELYNEHGTEAGTACIVAVRNGERIAAINGVPWQRVRKLAQALYEHPEIVEQMDFNRSLWLQMEEFEKTEKRRTGWLRRDIRKALHHLEAGQAHLARAVLRQSLDRRKKDKA